MRILQPLIRLFRPDPARLYDIAANGTGKKRIRRHLACTVCGVVVDLEDAYACSGWILVPASKAKCPGCIDREDAADEAGCPQGARERFLKMLKEIGRKG